MANDLFKSKLFDDTLASNYKNFSVNRADYHPERWLQDTSSQLTWFQDHEFGIFMLPSNQVPASHCDSIREILGIEKANFFKSNKKSFNNVLTFVESDSGAGLGVTLKNHTDLCEHKVFILPRDDLFINMP